MGILATDKNQLIYIYSEDSVLGKKILPYAKSTKQAIRTININKEKIADTVWTEIIAMLDSNFSTILDLEHPSASDISSDLDVSVDGWLKILDKNPSLLQQPIAIRGKKAVQIDERFDFYQFYDADGSNFDKAPQAIREATHKDTTDDNFNSLK